MALNSVQDHQAVAYRGTSGSSSNALPGLPPASAHAMRGVDIGNAIGTNPYAVPLRNSDRNYHPYVPTHGGSRPHQDGFDDAMDADPTITYAQVERIQTMSMSVPDQSMTRQVINEAERRHGQFQQAFHVAHCQSATGIVALARETLREQHGSLSERFAREEASLDGQRRTELAEMQSLMTADHHRRLALVENQAEALVDSNYQHE